MCIALRQQHRMKTYPSKLMAIPHLHTYPMSLSFLCKTFSFCEWQRHRTTIIINNISMLTALPAHTRITVGIEKSVPAHTCVKMLFNGAACICAIMVLKVCTVRVKAMRRRQHCQHTYIYVTYKAK